MSHEGLSYVLIFTFFDLHLTDLHLFAFLKDVKLTVHYKLNLRKDITILVITGSFKRLFLMHDVHFSSPITLCKIFQMINIYG